MPSPRWLLAALLLTGCADVGLETLTVSTIGSVLEVTPEGDLSFGSASYLGGLSVETLELRSTGDADLAVLDVYFDDETPLAYSMGDSLPLPMMLPPGEIFPVEIFFEPDAVGSYNGWVLVLVEGEEGQRELSRRMLGQGCDPENSPGNCS